MSRGAADRSVCATLYRQFCDPVLVVRGFLLGAIDHEHRRRPFLRCQFQPELLFDRFKKRDCTIRVRCSHGPPPGEGAGPSPPPLASPPPVPSPPPLPPAPPAWAAPAGLKLRVKS